MTDDNAQLEEGAQIVDVTITAPDADWLRQHCAMLIEKRLAASANIIPVVDSIYRWQGEIHHATEAYAILHSSSSCFEEIVELTNAYHPYDTAHVLASSLTKVDHRYGSWIAASLRPSGDAESAT